MADSDSFQVIFEKLDEARERVGDEFVVSLDNVTHQSEAISALMIAARDLAEPPPAFFTRSKADHLL